MAQWGLDIRQINTLASSIAAEAANLDAVLNGVMGGLAQVPWRGPDAERFHETWNRIHAPAARRAISDMRLVAGEARSSVEAQLRISARDASSGGGR
jgi:hypothetical protein